MADNRYIVDHGGTHPCQITARGECDLLSRADINNIFNDGLHEYLNEKIAKTARISQEVSDAYYF